MHFTISQLSGNWRYAYNVTSHCLIFASIEGKNSSILWLCFRLVWQYDC